MKILAIETSCDETAICLADSNKNTQEVRILGNALSSQIEIHAQYGGVFPTLAKRAHAEKIVPLIEEVFTVIGIKKNTKPISFDESLLSFLDEKESELKSHLVPFFAQFTKPDIDAIAVTVGPGLEPALWVGVNTARALSVIWGIPIIPINHMEGHFVTAQFVQKEKNSFSLSPLSYPVLGLLVSGGHTEIIFSEKEGVYKKIGQTRDDAVGEAFDKVARMLGLPYPGGPAVSKLAKQWRNQKKENTITLPRPMLHSGDYDFSFSGIKTAVLYTIRDITDNNSRELTDTEKKMIACEFENAVVEVLIKKTRNASEEYSAQTIIVGGGVAGNTYLKSELTKVFEQSDITLLFPEQWLSTDNAIMIAMAGALKIFSQKIETITPKDLKADGNMSF